MLYYFAMWNRMLVCIPFLAAVSCSKSKPPSVFVEVVEESRPIAYYRLESTSGISETGSSTYSSTPSVTTSESCAPIRFPENHCLVLNGQDGVITTTHKGGIYYGASIMAWVELPTLPSKAGHVFYVAGISEKGNELDVEFDRDDVLRFFTGGSESLDYKPDPSTLAGTWHMIVATIDAESKQRALYWDGKQVKSDTQGNKVAKSNLFSIGDNAASPGSFFSGDIDEVALWDRALIPSEAARIYNSANP